MKSRPWTLKSLADVGGTQGIGVRFFEEAFTLSSSIPEHRLFEKEARALLNELLPKAGSRIRGRMRSRSELAAASRLPVESAKLDRLLEILDRQLHILTPAESVELTQEHVKTIAQNTTRGGELYQLAHDYLVAPLRQWLMLEGQKTWRGRADSRLEESTEQMRHWPQSRYLPAFVDYCRIAIAVPRSRRNPDHRQLMRQATRRYLIRSMLAFVVVGSLGLTASFTYRSYVKKQNLADAENVVSRLLVAKISEVPAILGALRSRGHWRERPLELALRREDLTPTQQLYLSLALPAADPRREEYLMRRLGSATPQELEILGKEIGSDSPGTQELLTRLVADPGTQQGLRLRAAVLLAAQEPQNSSLNSAAQLIVAELVSQDVLLAHQWVPLYREARAYLIPHLEHIFRDSSRPGPARFAAVALSDYASDDLEVLLQMLNESSLGQILAIARQIGNLGTIGVTRLVEETEREASNTISQQQQVEAARRQARAATALLFLDTREETVWPLLTFSPNPEMRSQIIHIAPAAGIDPQKFINRLAEETNLSARRALIQLLGGYHENLLVPASRTQLRASLIGVYRNETDPGIHFSVEWLLRRWQEDQLVDEAISNMISPEPIGDRRWFHTESGHAMVVVPTPDTFLMGAPADETGRNPNAPLPRAVNIPYRFAIGAHEVTIAMFKKFKSNHRESKTIRSSDCPANYVSLQQAAAYCNWLSEKEGLELCYELLEDGQARLLPDFLTRRGYRLPLLHEAEYATRSNTVSSRYYGSSAELLPAYALFLENYKGRLSPVGTYLPNDFGLFDTLGNVSNWCHGKDGSIPQRGYCRGGSYRYEEDMLRSAYARSTSAGVGSDSNGFRVARMILESP